MDPQAQNPAPTAWQTGKPGNPDPAAFKSPHGNPDAVEHQFVREQNKQEGGKEMGLVHAPIVSMHPTSQKQGDNDAKIGDHTIIDNANVRLNHYMHESAYVTIAYPFEKLTLGQGMFIPVEENSTTDKLMAKLYKQVEQFRKQNSEVERDEDGDDVMEDVCINKKKRNEDGTVQLDGGEPRLTVKSGFRPKLIGPNFVVKAVVKGDKLTPGEDGEEADSDGALVIRVG